MLEHVLALGLWH